MCSSQVASSSSSATALEPGEIDPADLPDQNREQQKLILQLKALIRDRDEALSKKNREMQVEQNCTLNNKTAATVQRDRLCICHYAAKACRIRL